jgi:predicted nuclease of predicted toxin-antitoxin system
MIVWVDAQLSPAVSLWLSSRFGVIAYHVRDVASLDAPDKQIFDAACAAGAVLLTKDRDFVELARRNPGASRVIWITCGNTSNRNVFRILDLTFATACKMLESGEDVVEIKG